MSTWDIMKLCCIKETMPIAIFLGVIVIVVIGSVIWVGVEALLASIRKKSKGDSK